jgi:hypothetical protein
MSDSGPYEWLTVNADGSYEIDISGCSTMEMDRRTIIMQELQAGRLVLAPAVVQR